MIRLLPYRLSYPNSRSESKVCYQHGVLHIKQVMTSGMDRLFRKVLYSIIVTILGSFIFASLTPTLEIRAELPPQVSAQLLDEFFPTKNTFIRRPPDASQRDSKQLPPDGSQEDTEPSIATGSTIALTVTVTNLSTGLLPNTYSLSQNYPNPFNASTVIEYTLPEPAWVTLEIYNTLGQRVTTLVDEGKPAGNHSAYWDANHLASGIYFYRMTAGNFRESRKMVLVK